VRQVRIDFSGAGPAPSGWTLALLTVGIVLCIASTWRISDLSVREARAIADIDRARAKVAARQQGEPVRFSMPGAQVAAINNAVIQLNLPWQAIFESLETIKPKNIALLGLEPDGKKRVLRILAEAKQADDMLDFVRLIREQPQFADAVLLKHDTNIQDPNRPLRFLVEASWKPSL
jgi:hypothetical protein